MMAESSCSSLAGLGLFSGAVGLRPEGRPAEGAGVASVTHEGRVGSCAFALPAAMAASSRRMVGLIVE